MWKIKFLLVVLIKIGIAGLILATLHEKGTEIHHFSHQVAEVMRAGRLHQDNLPPKRVSPPPMMMACCPLTLRIRRKMWQRERHLLIFWA